MSQAIALAFHLRPPGTFVAWMQNFSQGMEVLAGMVEVQLRVGVAPAPLNQMPNHSHPAALGTFAAPATFSRAGRQAGLSSSALHRKDAEDFRLRQRMRALICRNS